MRGLGAFQQAQMKRGDPGLPELFRQLRYVLDIVEQVMMHPHAPPVHEQPVTTKAPDPAPKQPVDQTRLTYTIKDACKLIGIGRASIYRAIQNKELLALKCG
jgi:hypothetical protein